MYSLNKSVPTLGIVDSGHYLACDSVVVGCYRACVLMRHLEQVNVFGIRLLRLF
jgi:hypothetical protein